MSRLALAGIAAILALNSGCGYQVGGRGELVPKTVHTVAIPAFNNATTRYKITDQLPEAISREFISRTRYKVVSNPDSADAVLRGSVLSYGAFPTIIDPATSTASVVEFRVVLNLSLVDRATGKVIFNRSNFEMRDRYSIAAGVASTQTTLNQRNYFEETDIGIERASVQAARQIVSAILENF